MSAKKDATIHVPLLEMDQDEFILVGNSGLFSHRMGQKAKQQLLLGGRKKTAAEKMNLKHHPEVEFRDSMHLFKDFSEHTQVVFPATAVKSAMATAALVVEGITSADVKRLVYIPDEWIPIYGVPKLRMDITRSSDINRTPDVRTRAFFPEWATKITIKYAKPRLNLKSVAALVANAGIMCGIGDYRQEKGKGAFGTWKILSGNQPIPKHLLDLDAQTEAITNPIPSDEETERLLEEYYIAVNEGKS